MALPHSFIRNDRNTNNEKEKYKTQKINYKWLVAWLRSDSWNIDWKCKPFFLKFLKFFFLRNRGKKCKVSETKLTPNLKETNTLHSHNFLNYNENECESFT